MNKTRKIRTARNTVRHFERRLAEASTEQQRAIECGRKERAIALLVADKLAKS